MKTRQEAREYLRQYKDITRKAEEISRQIEYITEEAYNLKSMDMTSDRVQSSPKTYDRIGEMIGRIDAETERLVDKYNKELETRREVVATIFQIKNGKARSIIFNRYIDGFTWDQTVSAQDISLRWAHVLEERGLDEVAEIIS